VKSTVRSLAGLAVVTALSACTTIRETDPERTATEELLISTAADRALDQVDVPVKPGTKVFLKLDAMKEYNARDLSDLKYAESALRNVLMKRGMILVDAADRAAAVAAGAELIIEPRTGGMSINAKDWMIGIPSIPIPIPGAATVSTPQLAIFQRDHQHGISKFALYGVNAADGKQLWSTKPLFGESYYTRWVILLVGFTTSDIMPDDFAEAEAEGKSEG
jgi:hypothetical protein